MRSRPLACAFLIGAMLLCAPHGAQGGTQFRVCADPDNLPFSNQKMEGFENKVADVIRAYVERDLLPANPDRLHVHARSIWKRQVL